MKYIEIREWEIERVHHLALDREEVLSGVCRFLDMQLETVNPERTKWYVTQKDGPSFSGTYKEVACYVRGYATAWHGAVVAERGRLRRIVNNINGAMP